ncbi:MAG: alpha/beta fold hydrolase [Alphaproteobacteria bacterium]
MSRATEAPPRLGPRPLPLHLLAASATWLSSLAALPLARRGSLAWSSGLEAEAAALRSALASETAEALQAALGGEVRRRLGLYLDGIAAYRAHPYRRALADPPALWAEGTTRLFDYRPRGTPIAAALFVPSLINRAYILDLAAEASLMRHLAQAGIRAFLLDWAAPGDEERGFSLDDYIIGRLGAALDAAVAAHGGPVVLAGYCMGGLLALPLALREPRKVSALALLATPWDFAADGGVQRGLLMAHRVMLARIVEGFGVLPTDVIQALFAGLDPLLAARKFVRFATLDPGGADARAFVALEDWLNDGVPLAGPVARQCLFGWYDENRPGRGRFEVGGEAVLPARLAQPALVVIPAADRIVPPPSAEALAASIPHCTAWRPALGHIGMMASPRAGAALHEPLVRWIAAAGA